MPVLNKTVNQREVRIFAIEFHRCPHTLGHHTLLDSKIEKPRTTFLVALNLLNYLLMTGRAKQFTYQAKRLLETRRPPVIRVNCYVSPLLRGEFPSLYMHPTFQNQFPDTYMRSHIRLFSIFLSFLFFPFNRHATKKRKKKVGAFKFQFFLHFIPSPFERHFSNLERADVSEPFYRDTVFYTRAYVFYTVSRYIHIGYIYIHI